MRKVTAILFLNIIMLTASRTEEIHTKAALDSMVSTERMFAATSLREGIRASFMKYFADSAVAFSPAPYNFRQAALKSPAPADPHARTLRWEPVAGDVSSSGDLGYLMGPSTLTDHSKPDAPVRYGFYLSVWKKQPDGSWKVVLDIGTDATEQIMRFFGSGFTPLGHGTYHTLLDSVDRDMALRDLERQDSVYMKLVADKDVQGAYQELLDSIAVAIRPEVGPIEGRDSIVAHLTLNHGLRLLEPMKADVSHAGDLGYTYGAYKINPEVSKPSGFYVRIWKKDTKGVWKLAVEKDAPDEP